MSRLVGVALFLIVVLPSAALASEDRPTPGAVAVSPLDPAPAWWHHIHRRTTAPHGRRFVGRAIAGLPFLPFASIVGTVGSAFGYAHESLGLFMGSHVAAIGLAVGGGFGTSMALERALVDLHVRGLLVDPLAMRVGNGMLIAGVSAFTLGAILVDGDLPGDTVGLYLMFAGALVVPLAVVPYGIQIGMVQRVYANLPPVPIERRSFGIAPTIDPVHRTIGVSGTF